MIRALGLLSAIVLTLTLIVYPAFAESPQTIQNAVGNIGKTNSTAAVITRGNTNQNNNQNSLGLSNTTSQTLQGLNIGGISISAPTTGGSAGAAGVAGAAGAGEGGEGYVGYSGSVNFASPAITFGNSRVTNVNLPGLPGLLGSPGNFSQPYKPDVFINGAGPVRPTRMTYEQASECRGGMGYKDTYTGSSRGRAKEITLAYAAWDKIDVVNDISNYVGITSVEGADKPWLPAVCEAAFHAMEKGANYGVVEFIIRPKNTMKGFGFGSSGGGSVVPNVATAASPYGLAATLGFGVGWSSQRVEGEIMIQITGLKMAPPATGTAPAAPVAPVPAAATPPHIVVPNGSPLKLPTPVSPTPAPVPQPEPRSSEQDPAAAEPADFNAPAGPRIDSTAPVTNIPAAPAPTAKAPSSPAPPSPAPTTVAPTTPAPTTAAPANQAPANYSGPANGAPPNQAPAAPAPVSQAPTNQAPTNLGPTSQAPATFNAPAPARDQNVDPAAAEPASYNIPTATKNLVNGSANGRPPR